MIMHFENKILILRYNALKMVESLRNKTFEALFPPPHTRFQYKPRGGGGGGGDKTPKVWRQTN